MNVGKKGLTPVEMLIFKLADFCKVGQFQISSSVKVIFFQFFYPYIRWYIYLIQKYNTMYSRTQIGSPWVLRTLT